MTIPTQPKRRIRRRWIVALVIAVIFLLWCGLLARDGLALRDDIMALQDYVAALPSPLNPQQIDLNFVQQHVASLHANLAALRSHAGPLLAIAPAFGGVPGIGGDIRSASALLDMTIDLVSAGDRALTVLAPLWPPQHPDGKLSLEELARGLQLAQPDVRLIQDDVDRVAVDRQQIDATILSARVRSLLDRFDAAYPVLRNGVTLLAVAPQLLGADRPRTYLILFQNEDELRPTGGFISAAGRITLDAGKIISLTVTDSYAVDDFKKPYGDPPAPLLDYMGSELWVFRDSNWSPDFPTSARKAIELFTYTQGGQIDGVIGLNQRVVQAIMGGLGSVKVDASQPAVTAGNVVDYMRTAWAPTSSSDPQWYLERKDFIGRLMQAMMDRILSHNSDVHWLDMLQAVNQVLNSHDLLIYLTDEAANQPLARAGWDGAIDSTSSDYLMIVDSNLGFNKANAAIRQSMAYTVTLGAGGTATADLTLMYTHTGSLMDGCVHKAVPYQTDITYDQLVQTCYWDYERTLVPEGAQLIDATHHPIGPGELITGQISDGSTATSTEEGKTVFATLLIVGRGQSVTHHERYTLPASTIATENDQRIYRLQVQRQPGAVDMPIRFTFAWPAGYKLATAQPQPTVIGDRSITMELTLDADQIIEVRLDAER